MNIADDTKKQPPTRREKFIPISRLALMDRLASEEKRTLGLTTGHSSCKNLFRYLSVWRHQTYQKRLTRLKHCYLPFSPDRDTKRIKQHTKKQLGELKNDLITNLKVLLTQANYETINTDELEKLLQANSAHGLELKVDLSEFDEVLLFARGREVETIEKRVADNLFLFKKEFEVPVYKRLFLLLKMKSVEQRIREIMENDGVSEKKARKKNKKQRKGLPEDTQGQYVYLRLFKNIPQEDMEMMFPNTQIKLRLFDKVKLGVTAGGGTIAGIAGAASKIAAAVATANPIGLIAALLGVIGLLFRQIMSVFNTRTKYMMMLAQRLFFHSLANNRGVLTLLVDRAEEEDIKEEMLAYFFLLRHPLPPEELKENGKLDVLIEEFLTREFGIIVDFDLEDALGRLNADHLLNVNTQNTLIQAIPPTEACAILERKWRNLLTNDDEIDDEIEYEEET
jgi:DNA uptake protein ComE-like DNA-binding protein